jgi:tRNA threonylcarbamoyladenosine biosynthesis protein TsaB
MFLMTNLLAIDTSSSLCAIALVKGNEYFIKTSENRREHAKRILPMIEEVIVESDVKLAELDTIAINSGPGSFTGLRIGVGVAQGIALTNGLPVIPISSLAIAAMSAKERFGSESLMICQKARENEVYFASYRSCEINGVTLVGSEQVCAPGAVCFDAVSTKVQPWYGIGSGWDYRAILEERLGFELAGIHIDFTLDIKDLCLLAAIRHAQGLGIEPEQALPNYIKEQLDYLKTT